MALFACCVSVLFSVIFGQNIQDTTKYLDPAQPVQVRVEDLLKRMTLEEKIGQMNMPTCYSGEIGGGLDGKAPDLFSFLTIEQRQKQLDGCRRFAGGTWEKGIGPGGGFFTLADRLVYEGPRRQAEIFNELQEIATQKTRLKIPLLEIEEGTHGLMCSGGTIFPEGLAIGSTWNMDLVRKIYTVAAREARAVGIHELCTLVIEPNRDPRLGRNQEGFSEDPYVCSQIAEAIVESLQGDKISAGDKVIAALCHYPGQSQPVSGMERGAMEISERMLREVFLLPWVAGIKKCGSLGVMATYPAIDDVPVHSSDKILTKILREELGFEGLVLSEGGGIGTLLYEHIADSQEKAGELALKAGVDVGISAEDAYLRAMISNVREGRVSIEEIDRVVRRILTIKFKLGLFENPYVDPSRAEAVSHTEEHRQLALQTAREGIVLLKNENTILPLKKTLKSIAVIGPNADHKMNQLGDYVAKNVIQEVITVLEGIKRKVSPQTEVIYVQGCEVIGNDVNEIEKARDAAKSAEIAIVVVGENEWSAPKGRGTNGEGRDVASLDLTGMQEELVRAVYETGTPTIVVLINGRPLSIRWIVEHIPAIIEPWICGEQGGTAVADVLFGDYNPSGRLPITVPRHSGQLPVYYNYKSSKATRMRAGYADMSAQPLYAFGYGLSYTNFSYSNLVISPLKSGRGSDFTISVDVQNTGTREGDEVVQLYVHDLIGTVTTPVKELKGFRKITLTPGEKQTVSFTIGPEHLRLLDRNMNWIVEPGEFEVMIGASSQDIRLRGEIEIL